MAWKFRSRCNHSHSRILEFDPQYATAEDRANFVEWAIPEEDEEPSPFTWASVDESDSDNVVCISLVSVNIFLQIPGI